MRTVVTVARYLGCGGSYLGQMVAGDLGFRCLDREIISETAQKFSLDAAHIAAREEKVASFWERMLRGISVGPPEATFVPPPAREISDMELFLAEGDVMKSITEHEDCVLVGRGAAHLLPDFPGKINVLLHAPTEFRIPRVMQYYGAKTESQARTMIERSDNLRKTFVMQMTGLDLVCAQNYHFALDTSVLPLDDIAAMITHYVRARMALQTKLEQSALRAA